MSIKHPDSELPHFRQVSENNMKKAKSLHTCRQKRHYTHVSQRNFYVFFQRLVNNSSSIDNSIVIPKKIY